MLTGDWQHPWLEAGSGLGRVTHQHFVHLPHARFIQMLTYNAQRADIRVNVQEERYTSKASGLDGDAIPTYDPKREAPPVFSVQRIKRGLYRTKDGRLLIADVIGSYTILRKALPTAFANRIEAVVAQLAWLTLVRLVHPKALAASVNPTNQSLVRQCTETIDRIRVAARGRRAGQAQQPPREQNPAIGPDIRAPLWPRPVRLLSIERSLGERGHQPPSHW